MVGSTTFLFAGGGTGGHLFPGIAVADELRRRDGSVRIVFVGSSRSIESNIVAEHRLEHRMLPVEPLPTLRRNPIRFAYRNLKALQQAKRLIRELRPTAVIGLGGYASAPVVWAARRHRIPVILIEQNVIPGRTTRWLSSYADDICISFEETKSRLPKGRRIHVTGNPVRSEIRALFDLRATEKGGETIASSPPELLILGGSQGADSLNVAVLEAMRLLSSEMKPWRICHQTGPRDSDMVRKTYCELGLTACVEPFFHEMSSLYGRASLVISRSGATTLAELACAGTAMILVPYPHAADDHQRANALAFVNRGAAHLVEHAEKKEKTAEDLVQAMKPLLNNTEQRLQMGQNAQSLARPDAAHAIANVIQKVTTCTVD